MQRKGHTPPPGRTEGKGKKLPGGSTDRASGVQAKRDTSRYGGVDLWYKRELNSSNVSGTRRKRKRNVTHAPRLFQKERLKRQFFSSKNKSVSKKNDKTQRREKTIHSSTGDCPTYGNRR